MLGNSIELEKAEVAVVPTQFGNDLQDPYHVIRLGIERLMHADDMEGLRSFMSKLDRYLNGQDRMTKEIRGKVSRIVRELYNHRVVEELTAEQRQAIAGACHWFL